MSNTINVRARNNNSYYTSQNPNMAIMSASSPTGIHSTKGWTSCREYLTGSLASSIRANYNNRKLLTQLENSDADAAFITRVKRRIATAYDVDKTRVCFEFNNKLSQVVNFNRMKAAIKTINAIEKEMGVEKSHFSKVYKAEMRIKLFPIIGPKVWSSSSHAFSLYLLLLRCIAVDAKYKGHKSLKSLLAQITKNGENHSNYDIRRLATMKQDRLKAFIMNIESIYAGRSHLDSFTKEAALIGGSLNTDGISTLMSGYSNDLLAMTNLKKFL